MIGKTLQKRNLDLLTIGTGSRHVVVMARVHPGETPASFIMEGFLDFVTNSECALACFLREKCTLKGWIGRQSTILSKLNNFGQFETKVIPMLNPDGVALGNYRCSVTGYDLNRHWRDTNPWAQPGLHAVKTYLAQLEKEAQVDFCIDIHAHSLASGAFMYGNVAEDQETQLDQLWVFDLKYLLLTDAGLI